MGIGQGRAEQLGRAAGIAWRHRKRWGGPVLVALPFVVLLAPLAADLFIAIPWPVRKVGAWGVVAGLVGMALGRIWAFKQGEEWVPRPAEPPGAWGRWGLPVALAAATASLAWPFLREPGGLPLGDWDLYLAHFEAARRSLVLWGEFPWWGPYSSGGFPLAGNPQVGIISPGMAFVLAFGTSVGLRLATVFWMVLAVEGARRLGMLWLREPWGAALVGLVFGLNGGVMIYSVAGYYVALNYWLLPWLLLAVMRLGGPGPRGLVLGAWVALAVLTGIHYLLIFSCAVAAVAGLRQLRAVGREERGRFARQAVVAVGLVLAVCGWRLATTGQVVRDFPHEQPPSTMQSLDYALACWVGRPTPAELAATTEPVFWETNVYVGPLVIALALVGLARGPRWWHVLALMGFWLAFGGWSIWQPSYWLSHLPVFRSTHVVSRWRLVAALGVGLAAGSAVAAWRADRRGWVRFAGAAAVVLVGLDLVGYGHAILPLAFSRPASAAPDPGPPVRAIVQIGDGPEAVPVLRGYGVIRAHETQLGYDRGRPTGRKARGEPGYLGEAWTDSGPIEPAWWSPNRIEFEAAPGTRIYVNQNPGSWWLVNGRRAYSSMRCAEPTGTLSGVADASGRLEFRVSPPWLARGWALQGLGLALMAGAAVAGGWGRLRPGRPG